MFTWFHLEWHESYGKPLGENTFLFTWFWLSRSWHRLSCQLTPLLLWSAADSDGRAKWLDARACYATDARVLATPLCESLVNEIYALVALVAVRQYISLKQCINLVTWWHTVHFISLAFLSQCYMWYIYTAWLSLSWGVIVVHLIVIPWVECFAWYIDCV